MDILVIGIAGGSGSGKSTITQWLAKRFGDDVTVIRHDDYYKEQHDKTYAERVKQNYDCPEAFDTALLAEHLMKLRAGESIECPVYDYTIHDRSDKVTLIKPTPVLIIDGILVLQDERLRNMMDIKIPVIYRYINPIFILISIKLPPVLMASLFSTACGKPG